MSDLARQVADLTQELEEFIYPPWNANARGNGSRGNLTVEAHRELMGFYQTASDWDTKPEHHTELKKKLPEIKKMLTQEHTRVEKIYYNTKPKALAQLRKNPQAANNDRSNGKHAELLRRLEYEGVIKWSHYLKGYDVLD